MKKYLFSKRKYFLPEGITHPVFKYTPKKQYYTIASYIRRHYKLFIHENVQSELLRVFFGRFQSIQSEANLSTYLIQVKTQLQY